MCVLEVPRINYLGTSYFYDYLPCVIICVIEIEFPQKNKITKLRMMRPWKEESASGIDRYHNGRVFCAAFDNGDFKVVKLYDDPDKPGEEQYKFWVEKHYDGGVFDVLYYPYVD